MGKYDCQLKEIIHTSINEENTSTNLLSIYFDSFVTVRDIFFDEFFFDKYSFLQELTDGVLNDDFDNMLKYEKAYWSNIINSMLHKMIQSVKMILYKGLLIPHKEITEKCWEIYTTKNTHYGDAWFMNGSFGVFYDLHRKSARLFEMVSTCQTKGTKLSSNNAIVDTLIDIINYCSMLMVAISSDEILLFQTIGKTKIERTDFNNVEI